VQTLIYEIHLRRNIRNYTRLIALCIRIRTRLRLCTRSKYKISQSVLAIRLRTRILFFFIVMTHSGASCSLLVAEHRISHSQHLRRLTDIFSVMCRKVKSNCSRKCTGWHCDAIVDQFVYWIIFHRFLSPSFSHSKSSLACLIIFTEAHAERYRIMMAWWYCKRIHLH